MANRFEVPSSSPPSTPDRSSRNGSNIFSYGDNPSTTPAGPPPSSAASFTPAGAPSASYLGSSLMKGMTTQKKAAPLFGSQRSVTSSSNLFARESNSPLGRSVRATKERQPSRLSKAFAPGDADDDNTLSNRPGTFRMDYDDSDDDAVEDEDVPSVEAHLPDEDAEADSVNGGLDDQDAGDMWLDMDQDGSIENHMDRDDSDLMMLTTPAADDRVRREAEDIFRASAMRSGPRRHEFKCAAIAKDYYSQMSYAPITEPPQLILETESLVNRLYTEGVGTEDDAERLDEALATVTGKLTSMWKDYAEGLPHPDEEHAAQIGPGPYASPFENAAFLATLALQVHHTRTEDDGKLRMEPLPETLFRWLSDYHNPYPNQVHEVQRYRPSPASHNLFWETVFIALLRGQVAEAQSLLESAGWENVRMRTGRRDELSYSGRALENVRRAAKETCDMLESCPGKHGDWDIWNSDWTLFRIRARGALDQLRRFAEGKGVSQDLELDDSMRGRQSMTGLARKAESHVPWEVYEKLNVLFEIALGSQEAILDVAQDWVEASIGLFGWWDEGRQNRNLHLSRSQSLVLAKDTAGSEGSLERLARSFQTAVESDFHFNALNPVEIGMACVFEDNAKAVIAILRVWSLPIASAVAEIASLGHWLPPHQPSALYGFGDLDMDDLEVLGVNPTDPDEADGIKDNTLIQYAQELANYREMSSVKDRSGATRDGWEVAIYVLGRMDSQERSEETVGELVQTILQEIDVHSGAMVEKIWRLLNDLGMISFAEETVEHYGDILKEESHRFGEAMWYYALAHRPGKVREVMNLLISYSLIQSVAYPPENELDDHLRRLLKERGTTLEGFAKQDLEAAELLGKMLSGYATLRKYYEIRDDETTPLSRRYKAAAAALVTVIASSDDNIRGGLYDATRDAVVSEDFLLALLGEALVLLKQAPGALSAQQLDALLKAVEDIQTVGSKVYSACDEFFQLVLASAPGLKGSSPADLLKLQKSTSNLSASTGTGSYVLSGSSMLASQLHRSISGGAGGLGGRVNAKRGWDWRAGLTAATTASDVLRILRLGLTKSLARLWLEAADNGM
ncbi:Nucleoporin NUP85 [Pleurostoma richardsiae]|uniref:Nuclear pore complex protein Nup85 n=1 Tax=Pleurostoma richardsiae TaxID=41990 RepID=A0AA38RSK8_9PEZI|nr:Nucleoporin NUP85 [Pleurostoma richardsiae]